MTHSLGIYLTLLVTFLKFLNYDRPYFAAIRPQLIISRIVTCSYCSLISSSLMAASGKPANAGSCAHRSATARPSRRSPSIQPDFVVTAIDAVQMLTVWQINEQTGSRLPLIPILTVLGAMFIGFIELKSVYEKSEDKEKAKIADAAAALGSALKNRETQGIVAAVLEYMERAGRQSGSPRGPARSEQAPGPEFMPNPDIYDEE